MPVLRAVVVAAVAGLSDGHGIMWKPWSRANIAEEIGWEQDSSSIIAEPMPNVANRPYPFNRPWSEPGKSKSNIGPCGSKPYGSRTNWNKPEHGWGTSVTATYKAGEVVDVEWCVSDSADHGGSYSYRLCTDESITAKYIDPNYTPNEDDHTALEACFQKGILSCNDVPGQHCNVHPSCRPGMGCMEASSWFHCDSHYSTGGGGGCMAKGQHGACHSHNGGGALLKDKVKLPDNFASKHTLIGFRWDCEQTGQLWLHCADVAILPNDGSAPSPTPWTPAPQPVTPTPAPQPPQNDQCGITEFNRLECGYYGIDQHNCVSSGCCWHSSDRSGVPWCYAKADATMPSPDTQCQIPEGWRQDCGWFGVDEGTCESKGCCWQEAAKAGAPWCFHRATHGSSMAQFVRSIRNHPR
jgi:hypothetical protein